jgi:hypothetical protein
MNSRTPLILGLICLALGVFIWKFESKWKSSDERGAVFRRVFPELDREAVDRIEIRTPEHTVWLRRDGDRWAIEKPVKFAADAMRVSDLLTQVEFMERVEGFEVKHPEKELEQYGLHSARSVLRMSWKDKTEAIELRQGKDAGIGSRAYAQVQKGSRTVYVVPRGVFDLMEKPVDEWRDRTVAAFDSEKARALTLVRGGKETELQRKDGMWRVMRPVLARASGASVDGWLRRLGSLRVSKFVAKDASDLKAYGLDDPAVRVGVKLDGAKDVMVHFGAGSTNEPGTVFARRTDLEALVFTVPESAVKELSLDEEAWRDPRLAAERATDARSVRVRAGGRDLSAVQVAGRWRLGGKDGPLANREAIDVFLQRVAALEASRFVADAATDLKTYGLDAPRYEVEFTVPDGDDAGKDAKEKKGKEAEAPRERRVTLQWGTTNGGETICRNLAEPFILAVTNGALEFLDLQPWDWNDVQVLDVKPDAVTELTVTTNGVARVYSKGKGGWTTGGAAVDGDEVRALVDQAAQLRAFRWLGPTGPAAGARPDTSVRVAAGTNAWELLVWRPTNGGPAVAQAPGVTPLFFELGPADLQLMLEPPALATNGPAAGP